MTKLLTEEELYNHLIGLLPEVSGHTIAHIAKFIQSQEQAHADMVIGEDIIPTMNGRPVPPGESVTIDMENNTADSCKFIEANGKYILQQQQRKRNKL